MATGSMLIYSNQHIMRLRVCGSSLPSRSQLVLPRFLLLFIASYIISGPFNLKTDVNLLEVE